MCDENVVCGPKSPPLAYLQSQTLTLTANTDNFVRLLKLEKDVKEQFKNFKKEGKKQGKNKMKRKKY